MPRTEQGPSVVQDLGALADLYLTVFYNIGRRIHSGGKSRLPLLYHPDSAHERLEIIEGQQDSTRQN